MGMSPTLSTEEVGQLLQENHRLKQDNAAMAAHIQQADMMASVFVYGIFKALGYIDVNVVKVAGLDDRGDFTIKQPLIWSISQDEIRKLGMIFGEEGAPVVGMAATSIDGAPFMMIRLVSEQQADAEVKAEMGVGQTKQ